MAKEIKPQDTTRATAYELWMKAHNPMVTVFKTMDVTNLVRCSKKKLVHRRSSIRKSTVRSV